MPACGATDRLVLVRPPGARGWPSKSGSWAINPRVVGAICLVDWSKPSAMVWAISRVSGRAVREWSGDASGWSGQSGRDGQSNQPGGLPALTRLGWARVWLDGWITLVEPSGRPAQQWASHKVTMRRLRVDGARGLGGSRAMSGWVGQTSPALAYGRRRRHNREGVWGRVWCLAIAGYALHHVRSISPGERGFVGPRWGPFGRGVCPRKLRGVESSYIKRLFLRGGRIPWWVIHQRPIAARSFDPQHPIRSWAPSPLLPAPDFWFRRYGATTKVRSCHRTFGRAGSSASAPPLPIALIVDL